MNAASEHSTRGRSASADFLPHEGDESSFDLLTLARRATRGRMLLTAIIALLLGGIFAWLGYTRTGLTYISTATFDVSDIRGVTGDILIEESRNYDAVARKRAEFESDPVLILAANNPILREVGWPTSEEGAARLRSAIETDSGRRTSYFVATCQTAEPETAQVALQAVTQAFLDKEIERSGVAAKELELTTAIRKVESDIDLVRGAIADATAEYGTSDLDPIIKQREYERSQLQENIEELQLRISLDPREPTPEGDNADPEDLTPEMLAPNDEYLAGLLERRNDLEVRIQNLVNTQGPRFPEVEILKTELNLLVAQIDRRAEDVRERFAQGEGEVDIGRMTLDMRLATLENYRERKARLDDQLRRLYKAKNDIAGELQTLDRYLQRQRELSGELDDLLINKNRLQRGRVEILSPPSAPKQTTDKRPIVAGMGFVGGSVLGIMGVITLASTKRTFRFVDELENAPHLPPLLGTLPELQRHDPENERIAAVSVHNLRNTLQAIQGYDDNRSVVIACTSAEPGDGKTTLIQSLAASYALTGLRTILVDLDLVGGGLSARLGLSDRRGIADLLNGLEPTKCIKHTPTEKLYAMPAGDTTKCKPEQLASRPIQQVIEWLRERFDVILIDTGPALGSLEAGIVTAAADHTLLIVARGQTDRVVEAAVARLERLGVRSAGIVFNRADPDDLRRSLSAASVGAPSYRQMPKPRRTNERSLDKDGSIAGNAPAPKPADAASRMGKLKPAEDGAGA